MICFLPLAGALEHNLFPLSLATPFGLVCFWVGLGSSLSLYFLAPFARMVSPSSIDSFISFQQINLFLISPNNLGHEHNRQKQCFSLFFRVKDLSVWVFFLLLNGEKTSFFLVFQLPNIEIISFLEGLPDSIWSSCLQPKIQKAVYFCTFYICLNNILGMITNLAT